MAGCRTSPSRISRPTRKSAAAICCASWKSEFAREHRAEPFESHRLAKERAWRLLRAKGVFDISKDWPAQRERYGDTGFGRGCFLARKLIEAGVPFVEVGQDNYDSHADNFVCHKANMQVLDPAWSGLLARPARARPAAGHAGGVDGRGRADAVHQQPRRPRSLHPRLDGGAGRRRHQGRAGLRRHRSSTART